MSHPAPRRLLVHDPGRGDGDPKFILAVVAGPRDVRPTAYDIGVVDEVTAQVIVKHGADKNNKVSLSVTAPEQGEIVYRTVCGKYLPIVTRYQTQADERLMLAIEVKPCKE